MLFILVSKREEPISNPLIIDIVERIPDGLNTIPYIIDSFEYAIELGYDANYLNSQIERNIFWTDTLDEFIKLYLLEKINKFKKTTVFSIRELIPDSYFSYENEKNIFLIDIKQQVFIYDKFIGHYFNYGFNYNDTLSYKKYIRNIIKEFDLLSSDYTLISLENYLKTLLIDNYELAICYTFLKLGLRGAQTSNSWNRLFFAEEYFSSVKIYGLKESRDFDFDFKKDEEGKYFVQYAYNASESTTGRMFPINLNKFQALQTLPKESRSLLKAEEGCLLLEYDYKHFELAIFNLYVKRYLGESIELKNPHENICNLLGLDSVKDRQFGKIINYSIIYGMSLGALANLICEKFSTFTKSKVLEILSSYNLYSYAQVLLKTLLIKTNIKNKKLIAATWDQRGLRIEKEFAVLNNIIQGTGADILYYKVKLIADLFSKYKLGEKNKMLLQNHDSLLIQLETKVILETTTANDITNIFTSPYGELSLEYDLKTGTNWGGLK